MKSMDAADKNQSVVNEEEEEEEEEEVEEVEEVEEEVEEEIEEEIEEVEEEEGGGDGGGGGGEVGGEGGGEGSLEKGVGNVDSAGEEIKGSVSGSSSAGKIFVGGVAWETTEAGFREHFEKYGEITDSVIMLDKHTKKPRGFGFVTFADSAVIDNVLEDEHVIDGRTVEVKRTVPREDMPSKGGPKTKKIFVGGIPPSLTEDQLKEHFSSYGEVVEHQIMLDHSSGRSRGFGFVTFENEEAVEKIISEGKMHDLGGKQVEIKKAEPKKPGGDSGLNGRGGGYGASSGASAGAGGMYGYYGSGSTYGYGAGSSGYRSAGSYYGGSRAAGAYGRGYGYGGGPGYGAGYGPGFGGPMYGSGGYGSGNGYGGPSGYGGPYSGGGYGGSGSGSGGYSGGRGYGNRYHPYGR